MIHLLDSIRNAPGQKAFEWKARREAQGTAQPWQPPQFFTCPKCQRRATRAVWAEHLYVCPNCGQYQPIGGYYRLSMVLDHGRIIERGTHEQLIAEKGVYYQLYTGAFELE